MSDKKDLVLVVDDDEEVCAVLEVALHTFGFDVHTEDQTKKAMAWLSKNKPPKLIISDIMMPDGNGLDFCRWVRSQKNLEKVPMIMCTGLKDAETMGDALELGAVDFMQKPFKIALLREKIDRLRLRSRDA